MQWGTCKLTLAVLTSRRSVNVIFVRTKNQKRKKKARRKTEPMTKKERFEKVIDYFSKHRPVAETELEYTNPFELLVAVILSAQCTDKRVNMTMPALIEAFPTPEALAEATPELVFPYIKSISY